MGVGVTVITETTGGGRCGAAASLEQPATSSAHRPSNAARDTAYPPVVPFPGHCCINSESFAPITRSGCRAREAAAIGLWSNAADNGGNGEPRLELESDVDAVLVGVDIPDRAAGVEILADGHSTHENVAVYVPARAQAGRVADVVCVSRGIVSPAVIAPPRIPPARIGRRGGGNVRVDVGRSDPDHRERREIRVEHVPDPAETYGARAQRALAGG